MRRVAVIGCLLAAAALTAPGPRLADTPKPAISDKIADVFVPAPQDRQRIEGLLAQRMKVNLESRLLRISETALLLPFQQRVATGSTLGEHAGKFLDAAAKTWAYTGDARLKLKMDAVARNLIAAQLPDGYLGSYTDDQRWKGSDVWVHKYDLIGLLSYYQVTADAPALEAARKIGDLLSTTFGDGPGQRDITAAGAPAAMAATSVLEPMCILYRYTGEKRYLDFAQYIVRAYERPRGPGILKDIGESGSVYRVGGGKAYDLLSNLCGLLELYRLTGEETYLKPAVTAWKDILGSRLYVTGSTGSDEYFRDNFNLPGEEAARAGDGCTTVAWLQLNWQLLRLTGDPVYAGELERTLYNQLLASQDPRTGNICTFTPMVGRRRPAATLSCSLSSVPRGIALIPQMLWGTRESGLAVALYAQGEAAVPLRPDFSVTLISTTRYPRDGAVTIAVRPPRPARFPIFLRVPSFCTYFTATVKGEQASGEPGQFLKLDRMWRWGDTIQIQMDLPVHVMAGGQSYPDFVALSRGPQVLALERALNPEIAHLHRTSLTAVDAMQIQLEDAAAQLPKTWAGNQAYRVAGASAGKPQSLVLVPFADALNYRVWLLKPGRDRIGPVALTAFGTETWSRTGSVPGSICDERPDTYRTTFQGPAAKEDWYAVEMAKPAEIVRIVFRHGKVFENGGWFDASAGKPRIQIRRVPNGPWQTVATLDSYPAYTSREVPPLKDGEPFVVKLPQPVTAIGIRILGKPARSFSSCAELAAYDR